MRLSLDIVRLLDLCSTSPRRPIYSRVWMYAWTDRVLHGAGFVHQCHRHFHRHRLHIHRSNRWGEGDTVLVIGDRVRVTKPGRQEGRTALVIDPYWSGRIKVIMEPRPNWTGWSNPSRTAGLRRQQRSLLGQLSAGTGKERKAKEAAQEVKSYLKHELMLVERAKAD